jgi:glycosyltransferase involved in cell wall biosynthesis
LGKLGDSRLRVAVVADFAEEEWASMDLVADALFNRLRTEQADQVYPILVRPSFKWRFARADVVEDRGGLGQASFNADRLLNRFFDYPRHLRRLRNDFDIFHITDHSYAHLVGHVAETRAIVTCHDLDAFSVVLGPATALQGMWLHFAPLKLMAMRELRGLQSAAMIACDSLATRDELLQHRLTAANRTVIIHNGVSAVFSPQADAQADHEAARMLGPISANTLEILHVGSTIARKRIDVLLRTFAAIREKYPAARLILVNGRLTSEQMKLACEMNVENSKVMLPFVTAAVLAAIYRRAALVLVTSEREGFGLPLVEAMACGTPVIASDLAVLCEVGGDALQFAKVGDVPAWTLIALRLISERIADPASCNSRRTNAIKRAASFSWSEYARRYVELYGQVAASAERAFI